MPAVSSVMSFVKLEHTLFSIPLLLAGAFLGAGGIPAWAPLGWIVVAGVGARTLAMALNRILDRDIDEKNPRTRGREIPAGKLGLGAAWTIALVGLGVFLGAVRMLPPLCWVMAPIPIAIFVIYPLMKRFTALAHFGVGAALGFAPIGAYVAVTGEFWPWGAVHWLSIFTVLWVAGFDVIYATLDEDFDREIGLHSLPAVLGRTRALQVAALVHLAAFVVLAGLTIRYLGTPWAYALLVLTGALLVLEHRKVADVDLAFFKINAILGFVIFALVWVGLI